MTPPPPPPGWHFVQPGSRRLELDENEWILVRTRLSAGEQQDAFDRLYQTSADGARQVNPRMIGLTTVLAYLLDWSYTDRYGHIVPVGPESGDDPITVTTAALRALYPEDFDAILEAIKAHEAAMVAQRAAEKKTRLGAPASSAISTSPDAAIGPMSTSTPSMQMSTP
jgi:hypothetical protein